MHNMYMYQGGVTPIYTVIRKTKIQLRGDTPLYRVILSLSMGQSISQQSN